MRLRRVIVKKIPNLFELCYKQGVYDAFKFSDNYVAQEFVDKKRESGELGLLSIGFEPVKWREFRFYLNSICIQYRLGVLSDEFINRISSVSFAWCIFPVCMDFYLSGIEEWIAYPDSSQIGNFMANNGIPWDYKNYAKKKISKDDWLMKAQDFVYQRIHREADNPNTPSEIAYLTFSQMLWHMTRPEVKDQGLDTVDTANEIGYVGKSVAKYKKVPVRIKKIKA